MRGLTFPAMREAAANDLAIAARVEHLLYRTKEELYDYRIDPEFTAGWWRVQRGSGRTARLTANPNVQV